MSFLARYKHECLFTLVFPGPVQTSIATGTMDEIGEMQDQCGRWLGQKTEGTREGEWEREQRRRANGGET